MLLPDEDILHSVHRFRPKFLSTSNGLPSYYDPYDYEHTCILTCEQPNGDTDALGTANRPLEQSGETLKCVAVPFVASYHFQKNDVAKKFTTIVKQLRMQHTEDVWSNQDLNVDDDYHTDGEAPVCIYFLNGLCKWGSECRFSHSVKGQRTRCRFFFTLQGCRNGDSCLFSHDENPLLTSSSSSTLSSSNFCLPEDTADTSLSLLELLSICSDGYLLFVDDTNLHFTSKFASFHDPSKIMATTCLSDTSIFDPSLTGVKIFWGLNHPYQTIISNDRENKIPWNEVKCMFWFPNLESFSEDLDRQTAPLQNFFKYAAVRLLGDALEMQVVLTMNNIKFSQLQVEKLGRDSFFFLTKSFPFDEYTFGELPGNHSPKKTMMVSRATSYVFDLLPPSEYQFGNYTTVIQESLHDAHK